jgi:hypothetical protein
MARARRTDQTDPDRSRQLSAAQLAAVELGVLGKPDGEAAAAVGVSRQTIWGWRHYHPEFQATLNVRRRELYGQAGDRLRALLGKALGVLEAELDVARPDAETLKVALKVVEYAAPAGRWPRWRSPAPSTPRRCWRPKPGAGTTAGCPGSWRAAGRAPPPRCAGSGPSWREPMGTRRPRTTQVRRDAAHPDGRLTDAQQTERVARALATLRGERRATPRTRMDAPRWLLNVAWGPPPEGEPLS